MPHFLTSFPCLTYSLKGVLGAISQIDLATHLKFFSSGSASSTIQTETGLALQIGVGMRLGTLVESDVSEVPSQESPTVEGHRVPESQGADITRHPTSSSVPVHPPAASICY